MQLVLATGNLHKVEELRDLLCDSNIQLLSLRDFAAFEMPEETGMTMQDNARLKAEAVMRVTKLPALSDDSGIEVDFLSGAPGVHSARWISGSDEDRTNALLEKRGARYRCAICVVFPDGQVLASEAVCEGRIAREWKGENGFGYDPIFEIVEATGLSREYSHLTMAQVSSEIKAQVSHRARAVQLLLPSLLALAQT